MKYIFFKMEDTKKCSIFVFSSARKEKRTTIKKTGFPSFREWHTHGVISKVNITNYRAFEPS